MNYYTGWKILSCSALVPVSERFNGSRLLQKLVEKKQNQQISRMLSDLHDVDARKLTLCGGQKNVSIVMNSRKGIIGIRFQTKDFEGESIREYVFNDKEHQLAIQHTKKVTIENGEASHDLVKGIPEYVIDMLENGVVADEGLPAISDSVIRIRSDNQNIYRPLFDGSYTCQRPVICLTPSLLGKYSVDGEKLAAQLAGICHVIAFEKQSVFQRLKKEIPSLRSCKGDCLISYPDMEGWKSLRLRTGDKQGTEQITGEILSFFSSHRLHDSYQFMNVYEDTLHEKTLMSESGCREAQLAQNLAEAKHKHLLMHLDDETKRLNEEAMNKALQDAEAIVGAYEDDIEKLKNELYEKNLLLQGLEVENQRMRSHLDRGRIPLIYLGNEREFYLGEIQDLLLSTLEDALEDMPEKSRKRDVITDILVSNDYKHISKDRYEEVKKLLKGYDGMTAKIRHGLEEFGFWVEETNKHCKVTYHGDNRYLVIFGSTPSDVRSGKNNALTLVRMAY